MLEAIPEVNTVPEVKTGFEPRRGPYLMIPYCAQGGTDQHRALIDLYSRLQAEGLAEIVFHENPETTLLDFMNFFSGPKVALQIFALMDGDKVVDIIAMTWLADLVSCSNGALIKGVGSFVFFKDYQKPAYTDPVSKLVLDYWFDVLLLQTLVGLTPAPNRAASLFTKRLGFQEVCRIPNYTTFDGKVCDGIVSWMSRELYHDTRLE